MSIDRDNILFNIICIHDLFIIHLYLAMCSAIQTVFSSGHQVFCIRRTFNMLRLSTLSEDCDNFEAMFCHILLTYNLVSSVRRTGSGIVIQQWYKDKDHTKSLVHMKSKIWSIVFLHCSWIDTVFTGTLSILVCVELC